MIDPKDSFIELMKQKIEESDDVDKINSMLVALKILLTQEEWDNYLDEVT